MSDDLLRAADAWSDEDPAYVPGTIIKRLAARLREIEAERDALLAEVARLRGLLTEHRDYRHVGDGEAYRRWHQDWCARRDAALAGEKP